MQESDEKDIIAKNINKFYWFIYDLVYLENNLKYYMQN